MYKLLNATHIFIFPSSLSLLLVNYEIYYSREHYSQEKSYVHTSY